MMSNLFTALVNNFKLEENMLYKNIRMSAESIQQIRKKNVSKI